MFTKVLLALPFLLFTNVARAELTLTEKGVKNIGSSLAALFLCEREKIIPVGSFGDYSAAVRRLFPKEVSDKVMRQYQDSVHVKKLYSPSRDRWISYTLDKKFCEGMANSVPSVLDSFNKMSSE